MPSVKAFDPRLVRNNSDNVKLSLKTFLQGVKWHRYSLNYEGLRRHYKVIYNQIFYISDNILYNILNILLFIYL